MNKKILIIATSSLMLFSTSADYILKQKIKEEIASNFKIEESQMYAFTTHTFTNCGKTGQYGPTLSSCQNAYDTFWASDINKFNVVDGVQTWIVPKTGTYTITMAGGRGGVPKGVSLNNGGRGALISGKYDLNEGTKLNIVVGQSGTQNSSGNNSNGSGSGGGGSFLWINENETPIMVAGGGGGGSIINTSYSSSYLVGRNAQNTLNGGESWANNGNAGKNGGNATGYSNAKGWLGMYNSNFYGQPNTFGGFGGFGGGGVSPDHPGGGGGGYSGGGATKYQINTGYGNSDGRNGGGWGGSYYDNLVSNQTFSLNSNQQGYVTITLN